ncbi:MAG: TadE/TadG family type IV pilus assembly protein [Sphingomonadaceae bacterium]
MRATLHKQAGQITLMVALSAAVLVGVVGLALDAGLAYTVKAKLNAATDSASLAAARAVTQGNDQATQAANAKAAAARFFNANFPSNYMLSTATMNEPTVTFDRGKVTIDVTAKATMPVSLMGVLNTSPLSPGVASQTIRKDLDMVVVLDTSGSLKSVGDTVIDSSQTFLQKFSASQDRVGLLHFAFGAVIDDPIRTTARGFDRTSMNNHIGNYVFEGSTASAEGMYWARKQILSIGTLDRSSLRVIVFFSDGSPNSFATYLTWKTPSDCNQPGVIYTDDDGSGTPAGLYKLDKTYDDIGGNCTPSNLPNKTSVLPDWYNGHNPLGKENDVTLREYPIVTNTPRVVSNTINYANVNRAARNLVEAMASKSRDEGIFVFTLGLGSQLKTGTGYDKEKGEDTLKCMANSTDAPSRCFNANKPVGVYCYAATESDLTPCFSKLASAILRISK